MVARANNSTTQLFKELSQIKMVTRQIRADWTPEQREYRALLARKKLAELAFLFDARH